MTGPAVFSPRRIVVRSVNWLGDAVMTTPALLRLRERFPSASITLVCASKLADLWTGFPPVDEVIAFESGDGLLPLSRRIREGRFDLGITFPNSTRAALELRLAGVPIRLGYGGRARLLLLNRRVSRPASWIRMNKLGPSEIRRRLQFNAPVDVPPRGAHQIHHYLHLTAALGAVAAPVAPRLHVGGAESAGFAVKFLGGHRATPPPRLLLGLNPGAEYGPAKRWPAERFAAAAVEISQATDADWLIFGGKGDVPAAAQIAQRILADMPASPGSGAVRVTNVAGATSLRELMAGLKLCRVLLTNDSGPMHLAAAVGTPVVTPFGSTSRELTGPGLPGDDRHALLHAGAPCSPCFLRECPVDFRCMTGITVAQVVDAVQRILSRG